MNESDYILLHERSEDDDMINITNQDDTSTSITSSRLKPPTSRKVLRRVLAERAEEIIRQPVEDKPVEDKNIQYLRKMAEKKRLEKEKSQQNQLKAEKLRLKLKQSVLKRAAIVKAKEQLAKQQVETRIELKSLTDEEIQSKNEKARQAKRLREKQQQYLEKLANENQKKEREEASKEALETLRKNKREAALRDVKSKVFDEPVGSGVAAVRQIRKVVGAVPECSNEVQVKKSTTAALRKKQEEYLLLLQEKKKEEMDKENERQSRLDKIQIKAREAAHANHLQAKEQLLEKKKQLRDSTPVVVVKPKVQVDVDAMVTRLTKTSEKNVQSVPEARDFDSWKKRQGITDPGTKVFSITGWYPVIKAALEERGWVYNPDRESPFFDLKWTLKSDDLKSIKLNDSQYVNHFMQNTAITTKVGLLKNLKSLQWFESVDIDTFFPRAYDLNDETDMQVFTDDYKAVVAERLLKQLLVNTSCDVNTGVLDVVLSVCLKRQQILTDEQLDSTDVLGVEELVTDLQWKVLTQCDLLSSYDSELEIDDIRPQKPEFSTDTSIVEKKRLKKLYKARQKALETEKHRLDLLLRQIEPLSETVKTRITTVAQGLQQNCPQYDLNGAEPKNVWIVKPAGMSRGRGIRVFDDLSNLLAYTDVENHKESQWVVQKYIENPLLLSGRKFDIRQWVLVTNWNPLTVWFYDDCYLRFCVEEYSLDDLVCISRSLTIMLTKNRMINLFTSRTTVFRNTVRNSIKFIQPMENSLK